MNPTTSAETAPFHIIESEIPTNGLNVWGHPDLGASSAASMNTDEAPTRPSRGDSPRIVADEERFIPCPVQLSAEVDGACNAQQRICVVTSDVVSDNPELSTREQLKVMWLAQQGHDKHVGEVKSVYTASRKQAESERAKFAEQLHDWKLANVGIGCEGEWGSLCDFIGIKRRTADRIIQKWKAKQNADAPSSAPRPMTVSEIDDLATSLCDKYVGRLRDMDAVEELVKRLRYALEGEIQFRTRPLVEATRPRRPAIKRVYIGGPSGKLSESAMREGPVSSAKRASHRPVVTHPQPESKPPLQKDLPATAA